MARAERAPIVVDALHWRQLSRIAAGYGNGTRRAAFVRAQVDKWMSDVLAWNEWRER